MTMKLERKYIFITSSLSNMGGAQMYIRNKLIYLKNSGWDVDVVAGKAENVIIKELQEFKYQIPELIFNKYFFSRRIQRKVVERIVNKFFDPKCDEIVIESSTMETSLWAESVAKEIGAKHLVFLLTEHNNIQNNTLRDFFIFKHKRHELAGITNHSILDMFLPFYNIRREESYNLEAYCTNVEADVDHPLLQQIDCNDYDFIIGGLSRMEKPFVIKAIFDFCDFAKSYPDKKFLLLWIGDAPQDSSVHTEVLRLIQTLNNVEFKKTGYVFPVPTRLLDLCDVFITSAGSSWACLRSGIPTITYDTNDCKPIGILGRTTNNCLFRGEGEKPLDLCILLEQILFKKSYKKIESSYDSGLPDFNEHLRFLSSIKQPQEYYNMESICTEFLSEKKISFGLTLLGIKGYTCLHNILNRI